MPYVKKTTINHENASSTIDRVTFSDVHARTVIFGLKYEVKEWSRVLMRVVMVS